MKVLLSIVMVFIVVISPAPNLMASVSHGLVQTEVAQQNNSIVGQEEPCAEHSANQTECDSVQCVSALSVIVQTADKLVSHGTSAAFLLKDDSAFVKDNLSSLFRPPRG